MKTRRFWCSEWSTLGSSSGVVDTLVLTRHAFAVELSRWGLDSIEGIGQT